MLVRQIADHQRRRLRRFDLRECLLVPVRIEHARFVRCLAVPPALFLGLLAESPIAAQLVIEKPLENRQQRDRREMADQIGHRGQLASRCGITALYQPLAPLLNQLRNRRVRILRKWSCPVTLLITATQQFRQFADFFIASRRRALLDGDDKAGAGRVRDSIAETVVSIAQTFLVSVEFLDLSKDGELGID